MKENNFLLVSVKAKNSQAQGQIYVVRREDLALFVEMNLTLDSLLLIDTIETFVSDSLSTDETL